MGPPVITVALCFVLYDTSAVMLLLCSCLQRTANGALDSKIDPPTFAIVVKPKHVDVLVSRPSIQDHVL